MKIGWDVKPLGEVCTFRRGLTYSKKDEVDSGGTSVLRATNVDLETGELNLSEIRFIRSEVSVPPSKMVEPGTILICTASGSKKHLGKTALIDRPMDFAFGGFMGLLKPNEGLLPKYLHWLMRSDAYWTFIDGLSDGANINNLKFNQLSEFPIPLPSLEEQQRIIAVLDEAFESLARAHAHAEANLQNARELSAAAVEAVFGRLPSSTAIEELQDLCTERGITYGVIKLGEHDPEGVPCLRTSNVRSLRIDVDGMKVIAPTLSKEYSRTILEGGEVLVNVRGTLGGVATVPDHMAGWNISREVAMVPVDHSRLDPDFASFFVSTRGAQAWLTGVIKGAAYKGINLTDLRLLKIPVPGLDRQAEIVQEIVGLRLKTQAVEDSCAAKLQDIDDLRQSLLQKAFAGELT